MRKLVELRQGEQIATGLLPDVPAAQPVLWRNGVNVVFGDTRVEKLPNPQIIEHVGFKIGTIAQANIEGEERAYIGTNQSLHLYRNGALEPLRTSFDPFRIWSMETWGSFLIAVGQYVEPQIWRNAGQAENLATFPRAWAKLVKRLSNHLLYFHTDLGEQEVVWSSRGTVDEFAPGDLSTAGSLTLRDLDSEIKGAAPLGVGLGVYSTDSMLIASYADYQTGFVFSPPIFGGGALSDSAIIPVGGTHFMLGVNGPVVCTGAAFDNIGTVEVKRWLARNIDQNRPQEIAGFYHESRNLVVWSFPCLDGAFRGLGYDVKKNGWTMFDLNITAAAPRRVFPKSLVGIGQSLHFFDAGGTGELVQASIQSSMFDVGEPERYKRWDMVQVDWEGSGDLQVRFGFADRPQDEPDSWTPWAPVARENWIGPGGRESPLMCMAFRNEHESEWAITALRVFGEVGGWRM